MQIKPMTFKASSESVTQSQTRSGTSQAPRRAFFPAPARAESGVVQASAERSDLRTIYETAAQPSRGILENLVAIPPRDRPMLNNAVSY
jgi:hypothetical protein